MDAKDQADTASELERLRAGTKPPDPRYSFRVGYSEDGSFDELVVGNWLHIECMGDWEDDGGLCWWARIGNACVNVSEITEHTVVLNVDLGFYGEQRGEITGRDPLSEMATERDEARYKAAQLYRALLEQVVKPWEALEGWETCSLCGARGREPLTHEKTCVLWRPLGEELYRDEV